MKLHAQAESPLEDTVRELTPDAKEPEEREPTTEELRDSLVEHLEGDDDDAREFVQEYWEDTYGGTKAVD